MRSDNQGTAALGRRHVAEAIRSRGAEITPIRVGQLVLLEMRNPATCQLIHLRVKTRNSGTWQGSIGDGDPAPQTTHPEVYWVFVDLSGSTERPDYYIVPDGWMRRDIHRAHQEYLSRHRGMRAETEAATHHAIQAERVASWRNRWDQLGLRDGVSKRVG